MPAKQPPSPIQPPRAHSKPTGARRAPPIQLPRAHRSTPRAGHPAAAGTRTQCTRLSVTRPESLQELAPVTIQNQTHNCGPIHRCVLLFLRRAHLWLTGLRRAPPSQLRFKAEFRTAGPPLARGPTAGPQVRAACRPSSCCVLHSFLRRRPQMCPFWGGKKETFGAPSSKQEKSLRGYMGGAWLGVVSSMDLP